MKSFEQKFQECAAKASRKPAPSEGLPLGFAEAVLRRCARTRGGEWNLEVLWLQFGLRTLAGVSLVLVILSLLQWSPESGGFLEPPPIEKSIIDMSQVL